MTKENLNMQQMLYRALASDAHHALNMWKTDYRLWMSVMSMWWIFAQSTYLCVIRAVENHSDTEVQG